MQQNTPYLQTVLQSSPIGMLVFNQNQELLFSNSAAEIMFGKTKNEIVGQKCGDFINCLHRHKDPNGCGNTENCHCCVLDQTLKSALSGDSENFSKQGEVQVETESSDNPVYLKFNVRTIRVDGAKCALLALDDITERKNIEIALKRSEERFKSQFVSSPIPTLLWQQRNNAFQLVEANKAAIDLSFEKANQFVGRTAADIYPDRQDIVDNISLAFKDKEIIRQETAYLLRGTNLNRLLIITYAFAPPDLVMMFIDDITEVRENEKKYRRLVESLQEGIWEIDKDSKTTYVNPKMAEMLGYTQNEMLGAHLHDFMDSEGIKITEKNVNKRKNGIKEQHDFEFITKDGKRIYTTMGTSPIFDDNGEYAGALAGVIDITERKKLEQHKEDVDRIMRHDLKTYLNGIILLPEIVASEGNLTEEQTEYLQLIEESGQGMLQMIDSSLNMFKMETGSYVYHPVPVDVIPIIETVVRCNSIKLSERALEYAILVNGSPLSRKHSFTIRSDKQLLTTLLSNIFINSIEASPAGEKITISLYDTDLHSISICNKGTVPKEIRHTFFNKYTTHGKPGGTGIGTYSAKLIAEAMHCEITMKTSDAANSTCVSINIPKNIPV